MCVIAVPSASACTQRQGETELKTGPQLNSPLLPFSQVNATLMNIADNPTNVQLPGMYNTEDIPRVPVIATGEYLFRSLLSCHKM